MGFGLRSFHPLFVIEFVQEVARGALVGGSYGCGPCVATLLDWPPMFELYGRGMWQDLLI